MGSRLLKNKLLDSGILISWYRNSENELVGYFLRENPAVPFDIAVLSCTLTAPSYVHSR